MQVHFLKVQCSNCPLNIEGQCDYKTEIRNTLKSVLPGTHMSYKCEKYKTLYKRGEKVLVDLYNYRRNTDPIHSDLIKWEYYLDIMGAEGIVTGEITSNFLYRIELVKPAKLFRLDYEGEDIVLQEIRYQLKPANRIRQPENPMFSEYVYSSNKSEVMKIRFFNN
jgi:hypothetical protein